MSIVFACGTQHFIAYFSLWVSLQVGLITTRWNSIHHGGMVLLMVQSVIFIIPGTEPINYNY